MLVGRRQLRSNNSWMHNLELLVSGPERCTLHVHPDDAERLGLADGAPARVASRAGALEAPVEVTDAVMPGVVSLPHGWGHDAPGARLGVAGAHAGVNANLLADEELVDALSGNAVLNGIPVAVAPVARRRPGVSGAPDFAALGLLDGLDGRARAARRRCSSTCTPTAARVEELQAAVAEGRLALLPAERALGAGGALTAREVAAAGGRRAGALEAVRRACGLPLPPPDVARAGRAGPGRRAGAGAASSTAGSRSTGWSRPRACSARRPPTPPRRRARSRTPRSRRRATPSASSRCGSRPRRAS